MVCVWIARIDFQKCCIIFMNLLLLEEGAEALQLPRAAAVVVVAEAAEDP